MQRAHFIERLFLIVYLLVTAFLITFYIILQSNDKHGQEVNMTYYSLCGFFLFLNVFMIVWFSKMAWYFIETMAEAGDLMNLYQAKLLIIFIDLVISIGLYRLFLEQHLIPIFIYSEDMRLL